jgi:hypothetical protein
MMSRIDEALLSLRAQPQAKALRSLLERNMGVSVDAHEQESVGTISPADAAALSVIRAIFDGGPGD